MSSQTSNCEAPGEPRVKAMKRHKPRHRWVVEVRYREDYDGPIIPLIRMMRLPSNDWRVWGKAHRERDADSNAEKAGRRDWYEVRIRDLETGDIRLMQGNP